MQNVDNVVTSKPKAGGCVWSAPIDAPLPTDAASPLDAAYKSLGFISEDGVSEATSGSSNTIKAYGGDEVMEALSEHSVTYTYTPIETNAAVLAEVYCDDNVEVDAEDSSKIAVKVNSAEHAPRRYVFEHLLSNNTLERIVVPKGKVSSVGERKHKTGDAVSASIDVKALVDGDGNKAYHYFAKVVEA